MLRNLAVPMLVVFLLAGAACQSTGPAPVGSVIDPLQVQRVGFTRSWARELLIPSDQDIQHADVLGDQVVIVEHPSRLTHSLSLRDGSKLWATVVGDRLAQLQGATRLDGRIIINSETDIYIINATSGELERQNKLPYAVQTIPIYMSQNAVFGSARRRAFVYNIPLMFRVWDFQLEAAITVQPLRVDNERVFIADLGGHWAMLNLAGETMEWRGRAFDSIVAKPAINNRSIFVASEDSSLYAIDRFTGDDQWIFRTEEPLTESPVVLGNWLYLPLTRSNELVAIDPGNGRAVWRHEGRLTPLRLDGQRLLAYNRDRIVILDNATGNVLQEVATKPLRKAVLTADDVLVLFAEGGRIERLDPAR